MKRALMVSIACVFTSCGQATQDQDAAQRERSATGASIHQLEELSWPQIIDALDRQRTLFILPVGIIGPHGPHLPVGADTLAVVYEATEAAIRVSRALLDLTVVMMPPINYGRSGANVIGGRLVHPGTYSIRQSTLRALVADVGGQIAQNGFKWVFVMNGHGAPTHNIAINEACDFVSETFQATMLHLTGLFGADAAIQATGEEIKARHFSAAERSTFGMDLHAGVARPRASWQSDPIWSVPITKRTEPGGPLSRGVTPVRNGGRLAGLSLFARPERRQPRSVGMVEAWWIERVREF